MGGTTFLVAAAIMLASVAGNSPAGESPAPPAASQAAAEQWARVRCEAAPGPSLASCTVLDTAGLNAEEQAQLIREAQAAPACIIADLKPGEEFIAPLPVTQPVEWVNQAQWAQQPTADVLQRVYPPEARKKKLSGHATLDCSVDVDGRLACAVTEETPGDAGFGEAALKAAETFRFTPMLRDCKPVPGGRVKIPIGFTPPR